MNARDLSPDFDYLETLLSPRQLEVLQLIGTGLKTLEIAEHLDVSSRTVDAFRMQIRDRLELSGQYTLNEFAARLTRRGESHSPNP